MTRLKLPALLASLVILLFSGMGHSGPMVNGDVTLLDFDEKTDILVGVPDGKPGIGWYKRNQKTKYLKAIIDPNTPPSPCKAFTKIWNRAITQFPPSVQRKVLTVVLRQMAKHNCRADITRDPTNNPEDIADMTPRP